MNVRRFRILAITSGLVAFAVVALPALAEEIHGTVKSVDPATKQLILTDDAGKADIRVNVTRKTADSTGKRSLVLNALKPGTKVVVTNTITASKVAVDESASAHGGAGTASGRGILGEFWYNFRHNLFKPLLLFFYLGFMVPILRVKFEFPYVIYQALTIYLLLAIGWHGGEELSTLDPRVLKSVFGFMTVGFITNFFIGIVAYLMLRAFTNLRRVDQATVAGYYGSDSAGTFVTCLGVLASTHILYDAYMPVMLAIMEIPGCLVALYLVSRLRHQGMDALGNMPDEPGYDPKALPLTPTATGHDEHGHGPQAAVEAETELALEKMEHPDNGNGNGQVKKPGLLSGKLLHEVFLNSGLYLLFGGILIGFISGLQGPEVTRADDSFFITLFQGILCLFLLEMGMTASRKLKDLRVAGWRFVAFALIAPNIFATTGILVAHLYSVMTGTHFELGTYVLFAVLCGAASYIAVPAVQRMAIPEASPTLPLAASLGLTFSYNVTIGIPVYIEIAKIVQRLWTA